jgi:hypothetical protein
MSALPNLFRRIRMDNTCCKAPENLPHKGLTWRDVDHQDFDPEWGAIARYKVYCNHRFPGVPIRRDRVVATGKTWSEANTIADGLNERVRRAKGIHYSNWTCRSYGVRLESPSNYSDFCAARRARHNVA